ncbi:hypothetical protein SUGI_1137220 [Cryptomeria japonica]|nr:hypothetical protein SUGI_1137220 [Cryptomeria japonica]
MIRSWRRYAFCLLHTAPQEPLLHIFCTSSRMRFHKSEMSPHGIPYLQLTEDMGYAQNGFCKDAFKLFELMKDSGLHPNHKWAGGLRFKW